MNVFQVLLPISVFPGYTLLPGVEKTEGGKACSTYLYPSCARQEFGNVLYSPDLSTVLNTNCHVQR